MTYSLKNKKIWIAGHRGMVGAALCRQLADENCEILTASRQEVDLLDKTALLAWLKKEKPDAAIIAAAKVGGILANKEHPVEFLQDNLVIASNCLAAAHETDMEKLLFLGSTCIYPKHAPQPMPEDCLLTGALEPTNQWYALAKIVGVKLCEAYQQQYGRRFISAMPTNLYGKGDNYDLQSSHVLPALLRKAHEAKLSNAETLMVWGDGSPLREFLYVDDLADALVFLLKNYEAAETINVGSGQEVSIKQLAKTVSTVVGFKGKLVFDAEKPNGTPRKLTDCSKIHALGWQAKTSLDEGIRQTYAYYLQEVESILHKRTA